MKTELGKVVSPKERLCSFALMLLKGREIVAQHGCPIGTFCSELNKGGGSLAQKASRIFTDTLAWVEESQSWSFVQRMKREGTQCIWCRHSEGYLSWLTALKIPI